MARQVLPVIGAAIGAYFGGAQGAQIGWAIGSVVGNAVDPVIIKGPSIGDLSQQTAQEGVSRPIVFALSQPMAGNIIACAKPVISTKKSRQGKGGPVTETQSVHRTYAIGICEGPITALIRCWSNGSLVYDSRPGGDGGNNSKFLQITRIFLGGFDQMPSPDLEAIFGSADTPAHRGTAYIARVSEDLTAEQGAVPQFTFQVMRCEGRLLTSRPYAVEMQDSLKSTVEPERIVLWPQPTIQEQLTISVSPMAINRYGGAKTYVAPNEDQLSITVEPIAINRYGGAKTYVAPNEDRLSIAVEPMAINRYGDAVTYDNPADELIIAVEPLDITRSTP